MKATIGRMLSSETSSAALKVPTASATPVMISHSGLVCFPAAGKDPVGRRSASTKAQASTTNAATSRIQFSHVSGPSALKPSAIEECTVPTYPVAAAGGSVHGSASAAATTSATGSWPDSATASATSSSSS